MPIAPGFYWAKHFSCDTWEVIEVCDAGDMWMVGCKEALVESDFYAIRTDCPLTPPED